MNNSEQKKFHEEYVKEITQLKREIMLKNYFKKYNYDKEKIFVYCKLHNHKVFYKYFNYHLKNSYVEFL